MTSKNAPERYLSVSSGRIRPRMLMSLPQRRVYVPGGSEQNAVATMLVGERPSALVRKGNFLLN